MGFISQIHKSFDLSLLELVSVIQTLYVVVHIKRPENFEAFTARINTLKPLTEFEIRRDTSHITPQYHIS
jgi:hypothetical protein